MHMENHCCVRSWKLNLYNKAFRGVSLRYWGRKITGLRKGSPQLKICWTFTDNQTFYRHIVIQFKTVYKRQINKPHFRSLLDECRWFKWDLVECKRFFLWTGVGTYPWRWDPVSILRHPAPPPNP